MQIVEEQGILPLDVPLVVDVRALVRPLLGHAGQLRVPLLERIAFTLIMIHLLTLLFYKIITLKHY